MPINSVIPEAIATKAREKWRYSRAAHVLTGNSLSRIRCGLGIPRSRRLVPLDPAFLLLLFLSLAVPSRPARFAPFPTRVAAPFAHLSGGPVRASRRMRSWRSRAATPSYSLSRWRPFLASCFTSLWKRRPCLPREEHFSEFSSSKM